MKPNQQVHNKDIIFSKLELETIKTDISHILKCINLSEEDKAIRDSIIEKIKNNENNI
jgi:hypothetical protein